MAINQKTITRAIVIAVIFSILDYVLHFVGILPDPSTLPPYYFTFKLLLIPIYLLVVDKYFSRLKPFALYLVLGLLLQTRYFIYYSNLYTGLDHLLFIFWHTIEIWLTFMVANLFGGTRWHFQR